MKNIPQTILSICILLSFCLLTAFGTGNRTCQTECVTLETDGYVAVKIWDTKKGAKYKPEQARKDAIAALLYTGIAGTNGCVTQPPLLTGTNELDNFHQIEQDFFAKNGKWAMFTRSAATESAIPQNIGDKNWKVYKVSVSRNELRKYLEEQKIIKSLNSGF